MRSLALRSPAAVSQQRQAAARPRPRPAFGRARQTHSLCCAAHSGSSSHTGSDSTEFQDPWQELGLEPGASQDAISAAFRATILRCHPDLHLGAAWAVAKTQRVLKAVEELRGPRSGQSPSAAWRRSAGGRGGGDASGPFQSRGPNISFYPNTAFDFWSAYGDREPTPEEAKRFEQDWELAKKSAAERLRKLEAARTSAVTPDGELRTMPLAAGALAVALIMAQVMFVGNSDANNGAPKGAAASGDCRSRGGGFCRFM